VAMMLRLRESTDSTLPIRVAAQEVRDQDL
jgi:hypothetical protein